MIPGNDDAARAIALYCDLMARAALTGVQKEISERGEDLGAAVEDIDAAPDAEAAAVPTDTAESQDNAADNGAETAPAAGDPAEAAPADAAPAESTPQADSTPSDEKPV